MSNSSRVESKHFVGLDIGGTKLLVVVADEFGKIFRRAQRATPVALNEGLDALQRMIAEVTEGRKITAMGAAVGGPLDWKRGVVSPLHQPEWRNVPLKALMEGKWGCPFYMDVDTNVAALAEYHFGGERAARFLYLTLSTGMGGGFLLDGRIYRGMDEAHPEVGHHSVNFRCSFPDRIKCECGASDCLEALISGNAIRRIYGKPAEKLDEREWAEVSYNLGQGLRNLAVVYVPNLIVLGGGVAVGRGSRLIADASTVMREKIFLTPPPTVRLSRLGSDTAALGAIAAAMFGLE